MKTYEDLLEVLNSESDLKSFLLDAINEHKASEMYEEAVTAEQYYKKRNVTITEYRKLLYTMAGEAVPDNWSANYKFCNGFFPIFIKQECNHLLGNGVTFNKNSTKDALGGADLDGVLTDLGIAALVGGVSFGFYNLDHIDVFKVTEFVPLIGEEDGAVHAGIRFWQIDDDKPLRITLFEEDGLTEFIRNVDVENGTPAQDAVDVLTPKRTYKRTVAESEAYGTEILDGENYPSFPVVPMWGNNEHQSELTGLQQKIDGYDLIQSGFANDLDDASQIYWTIQNAGGMDDIDLAKFVERMKVVKAAVVDQDGANAEAHTLEVPYQARSEMLSGLKDSLYRDAMALDTDKISAGNVTATAINASYENLTLKCDGFEACVTKFLKAILALAGIDDEPTYKRSKIINMQEDTQMVLSAAQYLDRETILKHLPFLNPDEIEDILDRLTEEEAERYEEVNDGQGEEGNGQTAPPNGEGNSKTVPSGEQGAEEEVG